MATAGEAGEAASARGSHGAPGAPNQAQLDQLLLKVRAMPPPRFNVHVHDTRYEVVPRCCRALGWKITAQNPRLAHTLAWHDCGGSTAESNMTQLNSLQKMNHFPGVSKICQKCKLALTLNRLSKEFPDLYDFHPRSFCLPKESEALRQWMQLRFVQRKQRPVVIAKPDGGCQGNGIFLANDFKELQETLQDSGSTAVQEYLSRPYLINGYKFDLRVYVLLTSCTPRLRAFQHKAGLVRFCTEKYVRPKRSNLKDVYMHLTNYAVNKHNSKYQQSTECAEAQDCAAAVIEDEAVKVDQSPALAGPAMGSSRSQRGDDEHASKLRKGEPASAHRSDRDWQSGAEEKQDSKWSLERLFEFLTAQGHDVEALQERITDVLIKTLLSIQHSLAQEYRACFPTEGTMSGSQQGFRCFEVLGFDIMLDRNLKPWVIEVNHSPSLHCDSELDYRIKTDVIQRSLVLGSIDSDDLLAGAPLPRPLTFQEQKEKLAQVLARRTELAAASSSSSSGSLLSIAEQRRRQPKSLQESSHGEKVLDPDRQELPPSAAMGDEQSGNQSSRSTRSPRHSCMEYGGASDIKLPQSEEDITDTTDGSSGTAARTQSQSDSDEVDLSLEEKIEALRTAFEDANCGDFMRILPFPKDAKMAEAYRRIEGYRPALFKESPVALRRREAIEKDRKKQEAVRLHHRAMVGDRPAWGTSGRGKVSTAQQQQDAALEKLRETLLNGRLKAAQNSSTAPLPRVAALKSYERSYRSTGERRDRDISPRQAREQQHGAHSAFAQRQAAAVKVQTFTFGGGLFSSPPGNGLPPTHRPRF